MNGHVPPFFPRDGDDFVWYAGLDGPYQRRDYREDRGKATERSRGDMKESIV